MTARTNSIFVVGVPDGDPTPPQRPARQPAAWNHMAAPQPTHFSTTPTTMTHPPKTLEARNRDELHLQTTQAVGAAQFALNTYDLPEASKALRQALELTDRLALARAAAAQATAQVATNASAANEWAGYDLNAPSGESPDAAPRPATAVNASKPADEFAGYDLNAL